MLSADGDREAGAAPAGLSAQSRLSLRDAHRPGPLAEPDLRLADAGMRALAGLMGIASSLEGRRPIGQGAPPVLEPLALAKPREGHRGPRRAEVAQWASVDLIDRQRPPTADGAFEVQAGRRPAATADRILFALADWPGAPEVEVGSAWFA